MARMLIVDDEPAHVVLAKLICERLGHTVATATNGQDALNRLQAEAFDLVLMDVVMPGLTGLELAERLRADPALARVAVVCLTAAITAGDKGIPQAAGVDHWVTKPYDRKALEHGISVALGRRGDPQAV